MKPNIIRQTIVGRLNYETLLFTAGMDVLLDKVLIEVDCIGSAAHVTMLSKINISPKIFKDTEKNKVIKELINIIKNARKGSFKITNKDQDVHLAIERVLTQRLGETGKKIHTARSRNDQIAVDLRLYAKNELRNIMNLTIEFIEVMLTFSRKHINLPMVGRTHMQPAMPSSVGLWASAHAESLLDDQLLLTSAYKVNNRNPLGSAAGYGVSLNIDRNLTSSLLGFEAPYNNVLYAGNARGKCESIILSALSQVMITLSRLAEDLIIYSMPEFCYFILPDDYCTGSSIMPQKNNPDVLELVRAKTGRVIGNASTIAGIIKGLPSGYNRDLQEIKPLFMEGIQLTSSCLQIMIPIIRKLKVNKKALLAGFTPQVFAADRALELTAEGMSFRDAYNYVKIHIDELKQVDPYTAIRNKIHPGSAVDIDFKKFNKHLKTAKGFLKKEERKYYSAISKLLGVKYPELIPLKTRN